MKFARGRGKIMEVQEPRKRRIKDWTPGARPRERLIEQKAGSLSHTELMAILIATGHRQHSAMELAGQVLSKYNNSLLELGKCTVGDLMSIKGIGKAKAVTIIAALELGRRRQAEQTTVERYHIRSSRDSWEYVRPRLADYPHEHFALMYITQGGWVKAFEVMSVGGMTSTTVDLRLIFKKALEESVVSIIVFHNHPSGNLRPSKADEALTQKLNQASKIMDIKLLDHVIVGSGGYYSFADHGLLH